MKKPNANTSRQDGEEDEKEAGSASQRVMPKLSAPSLYPSWKNTSSDSEFSDPEGNAQSKLRYECTCCMVSCDAFLPDANG